MAGALIIDDDEPLLESLTAYAQAAGVDVDTATSWDDGLAAYQALGHPLVVCDYNLPGSKHGLRLMSRIRQHNPATRLVLLSGYVREDDVPALMATGVVDEALIKGSEETQDRLGELFKEAHAPGARKVSLKQSAAAHVAAGAAPTKQLDELDELLGRRAP